MTYEIIPYDEYVISRGDPVDSSLEGKFLPVIARHIKENKLEFYQGGGFHEWDLKPWKRWFYTRKLNKVLHTKGWHIIFSYSSHRDYDRYCKYTLKKYTPWTNIFNKLIYFLCKVR